jgi:hypothetical protein
MLGPTLSGTVWVGFPEANGCAHGVWQLVAKVLWMKGLLGVWATDRMHAAVW